MNYVLTSAEALIRLHKECAVGIPVAFSDERNHNVYMRVHRGCVKVGVASSKRKGLLLAIPFAHEWLADCFESYLHSVVPHRVHGEHYRMHRDVLAEIPRIMDAAFAAVAQGYASTDRGFTPGIKNIRGNICLPCNDADLLTLLTLWDSGLSAPNIAEAMNLAEREHPSGIQWTEAFVRKNVNVAKQKFRNGRAD